MFKLPPHQPLEMYQNLKLRKQGYSNILKILRLSQPNGALLSAVILPYYTFTGQA